MKCVAIVLVGIVVGACETKVVDLGIDAPPISQPPSDAASSACRCRIPSCRSADECITIGGACGADQYCVGDFGACTTDQQCRASGPNIAVCTRAADSTMPCGG